MQRDADSDDARWVSVRRITALGEPLLELQPAGGEIRLAFGGDVANCLACLARILGAGGPELSLVSALGDSGYSEWLRERLRREGIRLSEPPLTGEPGLYGLPLDPVRRPGFSYWRARSAASEFLRSADPLQLEALLGDPDVLVVTGITLALCSAASFRHLCQWIDRHRIRCRIVFDVNYRARLWRDEGLARERIGRLEALAEVIATGTEDERALWGCADEAAVMRRLGRPRVECVIRGGAAGSWVGTGERWRHIPTVPVRALDTAGAGDSHLAGYLAARIRGRARAESAAYANQVAALIVAQRGAAPREGLTFPPLPAQMSGSTS